MKHFFRLATGLLLLLGAGCSTSSSSLGSLPLPGAKQADTHPVRNVLEFDGEPTGPSIYDKCRRTEPAGNVLRLACPDGRWIRISVFPEDVRLASIEKSSQTRLEQEFVDVRRGDYTFDALTYRSEARTATEKSLGQNTGIVIEIRKPPEPTCLPSAFELTDFGRRVLAGEANQVWTNGIDRWIGGMYLSSEDGQVWWRNRDVIVPAGELSRA